MQKQLDAVKEFHQAFGIGFSEIPRGDLGESKNILRYNLMKEENEEYLEAVQNNDKVEIADALGDMLYILCGTIIEHGLQHKIEQVFDEPHINHGVPHLEGQATGSRIIRLK